MLPNLYPLYGLFQRNFLAHKGGRWDVLAGNAPASDVQERGPVGCCAHRAGISVCANQLQHTRRGPVVEGQLPGAVATHPDPQGPQQHGHAGHGLLSWRRHRHIVVGLGLEGEKKKWRETCDQRNFLGLSEYERELGKSKQSKNSTNPQQTAKYSWFYTWFLCGCRSVSEDNMPRSPFCLRQMSELNMLTSAAAPSPPPTNPTEIKNSSSLIYQIAVRLLWQTKSSSILRYGQFPQWALDNYKKHRGANNSNFIVFLMVLCHRQLGSYSCRSLTLFPFPFTTQWTVTGLGFSIVCGKCHQKGDCVLWAKTKGVL